MSELRAIIFDLDGTIVLSLPTHFEAYERLFAEFGAKWDFAEFEKVFTGTGAPGIIQNILARQGIKELNLPALVARKRDLFNKILEEKTLQTVPGFFEFLSSVRTAGLKKGIASGSSRANIFRMLQNIGVSADFPEVVSGEDVPRPKPAPDIYLAAAQRIGVSPHACFAIEDTPEGVMAAKAAGMKCAAFTTTIQKPKIFIDAGADLVTENYKAISLAKLKTF